eukprot:1141369-Pelagomonas_calceolata.AAC.1
MEDLLSSLLERCQPGHQAQHQLSHGLQDSPRCRCWSALRQLLPKCTVYCPCEQGHRALGVVSGLCCMGAYPTVAPRAE